MQVQNFLMVSQSNGRMLRGWAYANQHPLASQASLYQPTPTCSASVLMPTNAHSLRERPYANKKTDRLIQQLSVSPQKPLCSGIFLSFRLSGSYLPVRRTAMASQFSLGLYFNTRSSIHRSASPAAYISAIFSGHPSGSKISITSGSSPSKV